jgi:U1 small nuclear ribonucleoprotein
MTDKLPPNLLALFAPRPPLRWVPPSDHAPGERKTAPISGIASFLPALQEYKETDKYVPTESWLQRRDRIRLEKKETYEKLTKEAPSLCKGVPICLNPLFFPLSDFMDSHSLMATADFLF